MTGSNDPSNFTPASQFDDAPDPQETLKRSLALDQVLRMRFRDYSPDVEELAPLNSISDAKTYDDVFARACYEKTFKDFCRSVDRIFSKYEELTEAPRLNLASVFNNHVATVLGRPGEITAQFLKMSVRRISPELAEQLDFDRAKSEPTVFVFGNNVSRICDLIFTIPYKDGRRESFPIIVLMEHKSAPDRNVVQQMLTSLVATLDFARRYPDRFKTAEGRTIWPFVVLFYTGAQPWDDVKNLSDLFTTSLKELDQDWIFNLRFLLISLVQKKIEVVPTISGKEEASETFDDALVNSDWLEFFFDLLRKAELLTSNPNVTREKWLENVGESLHILKDVYDPGNERDVESVDDALSFVSTMRAKKDFALPTYGELSSIMDKEGVGEMIRRIRLLSDEEREAAERKGRSDGERVGERNLLARMIGWRFPTANPEFIQNVLNQYCDSHTEELSHAMMAANTIKDFQNRVQALAPGC